MRTEKSWTRKEYEKAYWLARYCPAFDDWDHGFVFPLEIIKAADYSYQVKDYDVRGWSSNAREKRFYAIKWRVLANGHGPNS